ncbi:MAG TPA: ribosome biogenesis GTPase YlqF [Oculatellaceae cyanobacterium]
MPSSRPGTGKGVPSTAFQRLREQIKWVDLVFEVVDGRVPVASRHPNSEEIFGQKPRLLVITKEDLSDRRVLEPWHDKGVVLSLKTGKGRDKIFKKALDLTKDKRESLAKKGILPRPMRICVVGMPNVGKSSLINWLIGTNKAKVADRPGVTKGNQWVRVHPQIELLDTPGILPVSALSKESVIRLALFNLVPGSNYEVEEVARVGLDILKSNYPELMKTYAAGAELDGLSLEAIAQKKNFITTGAKPDYMRAAATLLSDVRSGKFGRVSLE